MIKTRQVLSTSVERENKGRREHSGRLLHEYKFCTRRNNSKILFACGILPRLAHKSSCESRAGKDKNIRDAQNLVALKALDWEAQVLKTTEDFEKVGIEFTSYNLVTI